MINISFLGAYKYTVSGCPVLYTYNVVVEDTVTKNCGTAYAADTRHSSNITRRSWNINVMLTFQSTFNSHKRTYHLHLMEWYLILMGKSPRLTSTWGTVSNWRAGLCYLLNLFNIILGDINIVIIYVYCNKVYFFSRTNKKNLHQVTFTRPGQPKDI